MYTLSKKSAFLIAVRVLVLLYIAALLQLCSTANCACADTDAGDYEEKALSNQAADVVQCCCSAKSGSEVGGLSKNRLDVSSETLCGVQALCCCESNNDFLDPGVQAAVFKVVQPLNFKDVFRVLTSFFCMADGSHGAYSTGYHAEMLPFQVSHHISTTVLLL